MVFDIPVCGEVSRPYHHINNLILSKVIIEVNFHNALSLNVKLSAIKKGKWIESVINLELWEHVQSLKSSKAISDYIVGDICLLLSLSVANILITWVLTLSFRVLIPIIEIAGFYCFTLKVSRREKTAWYI